MVRLGACWHLARAARPSCCDVALAAMAERSVGWKSGCSGSCCQGLASIVLSIGVFVRIEGEVWKSSRTNFYA